MPKEINRVMAAYNDIVVDSDFNSRRSMGNLDELAASIKAHGLIQPIVVREGGPARTDGKRKLFLVAGERRYRACGLLGLKQVEVKLIKGSIEEVSLLNLIENEQRDNLEPLESAQAIAKCMDAFKYTQAQVAEKLGKSVPYISQRLALLTKTTPEVKDALEKGKITSSHAREIATLPPEQQNEVLEKAEKITKETGKKALTALIKDEADLRKAQNRRKEDPDYDRDKIKAFKEATEGKELAVRPKPAVLEMMGLLMERIQRAKTPESRASLKAQFAFGEWLLSLRDTL